jgi:hypothetical protein
LGGLLAGWRLMRFSTSSSKTFALENENEKEKKDISADPKHYYLLSKSSSLE